MTIAIDTNILFDILLPDPEFKEPSFNLLIDASRRHKLIVSGIVYAELASQFEEQELLDSFLCDYKIFVKNTTSEGLWEASRAWNNYINNRNRKLQCSNCGHLQSSQCEECGQIIKSRQHIIPDFIIGGHALELAEKLITRDRGFYEDYFPKLEVLYYTGK